MSRKKPRNPRCQSGRMIVSQKNSAPGGLRLVDHRAVKRRIDACLPCRRDVLEIRPGGMHFTEAHIGEPRGALCRRQGPWRVVRLEHHGIECGKLVHRR